MVRCENGFKILPAAAAARGAWKRFITRFLPTCASRDDEIVDVEIVIVLRIGDRRLQHLLTHSRAMRLRENSRSASAAATFLPRIGCATRFSFRGLTRGSAADRFRLGVGEVRGARLLAHYELSFAFLSPPRMAVRRSRVGENSPSLWPTMSSVTSTGMCFWPL